MKATNLKLKQRAKNLLRAVAGAKCPTDDLELENILTECKGKLKLAAAMILLQQSVPEAQQCWIGTGAFLQGYRGD